ncbi:MAG: hypothetical protein WCG34_03820 [Leptolinea sp.]
MSSSVEENIQQKGLDRVDRTGLESIRKSWLVPRGTGTLAAVNPPKSILEANSNLQPQLDGKNFDIINS